MSKAISFATDCDKKKVTITWKVTITGPGRTPARVQAIKNLFDKHYNPKPPLKVGGCSVKFVADFQERAGEVPMRLSGDRDFIRIGLPESSRGGGGGGFTMPMAGKPTTVAVNPRRDTGDFAAWELINEIGHAFGLVDRPGDLEGEWNVDKIDDGVGADGKAAKVVTGFSVKDRDVAAIVAAAPRAARFEILRCCDRKTYDALLGKLPEGERKRDEEQRRDGERRAGRLLRRVWEMEEQLPPIGKPFEELPKLPGGKLVKKDVGSAGGGG